MQKKNILSVITAALLSVCFLTVNCFAFEFEGENRDLTDIYSDWFLSTRDFVTGQSSFEQWRNSNIRFQTDIIGSNLFPGTENEFQSFISEIEEKLQTAVEGTENKVDDSFIDILGRIVGFFDFRSDFEQWYQDKYGKEYGKHENASGSQFDTSGMNYYIFGSTFDGYDYRIYLNYSGKPITLYTSDNGQYFLGSSFFATSARTYLRSSSDEDWRGGNTIYDWSSSYSFVLSGSPSVNYKFTVSKTNLPFNSAGDLTGGDPVTDWDSEFPDEVIAPTITLPEIGDLLTDLDDDLKNTDSDPDNPNKGVEIKITQLTNKLHNDLSKVIDYLKKILDKLIEFFDNFFENLGEFFVSVFVPQDDYFNNAIMDIKAEFDDAFSFAGDLRLIVDSCINSYKSGGTRAPEIEISVDGYGSPRKLDFSIFDKSISLVRSVICAICYASFALSTYRRIPLYISGGGDR